MKKVLFVQYPDFRDIYNALSAGRPETYYCQKALIDFVCGLLGHEEIGEVSVISLWGKAYDEILPCGVRVVGLPLRKDQRENPAEMARVLDSLQPTHAVIECPLSRSIIACVLRHTRILVMIADHLAVRSIKDWVRLRLLGTIFMDKRVEFVANHNIPASFRLRAIGVSADKIIPWDYPWLSGISAEPVKDLKPADICRNIFYAGVVSENKGVGDIIGAVKILKTNGYNVRLSIAGEGDIGRFRVMAGKLDVAAQVEFLGGISHDAVMDLIRRSDAIVVPRRYTSNDGLPCVIYEALLLRTPLLVSDHPMIRQKIKDRVNGLVFKAGRPRHIAGKIAELFNDPVLYRRLSAGSRDALKDVVVPVSWFEVVNRWLRDTEEDRRWLKEHSLKLYGG